MRAAPGDEVLVLLDLHARVARPVLLAAHEQTIDLDARVEQEAEVVVARRVDVTLPLGEQDELPRAGQQQVCELAHDLGVEALEAEDRAVERVHLGAELGRQGAGREGQLHVVEAQHAPRPSAARAAQASAGGARPALRASAVRGAPRGET
ncbi:MAG: hypothetical protein FJ148_26150, partial [Deltaproteobacteria bacterium]|nr:hypothetical protein [Deltaproteobacteria bacterium]